VINFWYFSLFFGYHYCKLFITQNKNPDDT
jgi:hypothetical protein